MVVFDWVTESGKYIRRGYIFKTFGKRAPTIIGRQDNLKNMFKEKHDLKKEIHKIDEHCGSLMKYLDKNESVLLDLTSLDKKYL